MKIKLTVDDVALATLVCAVVAISAVSAVAVISAESLITTNERASRMQRTVSSLEGIRFHSFAIGSGEKSYVFTGGEKGLMSYHVGSVEIEAHVAYLAGRRSEHPELARRFSELEQAVRRYVESERKIVEMRRTMGERAAADMVRSYFGDANHLQLLQITYELLDSAHRQLAALEADQIAYGDKVRRLILALISSAAFILVFLYGSLRRLSIEQRVAQARFAHQATHDSLTGLCNRPAVMEHIAKKLANGEHEASFGGLALLLLDLDGFKAVNDSLGHDVGDALLREAANRMQTALRDSDYLARLGGDEFLVVVPQVSDVETAERVGKKLAAAVSAPYDLFGESVVVTVSIGVSMFPKDARDREGLLKCADLALYEAKNAGRNQLSFYSLGMRGNTQH